MYFLGNAPEGVSNSVANGTIYYLDGTSGWSDKVGGLNAVQVNHETDGFKWSVANDEITITGYTSSNTSAVIPATIFGLPVTGIADKAFYNCTSLTSVEMPASVRSIGRSAFNSCTGLTSVTIPGSVTSIGAYAFSNCTGLGSVTIPSSVTSIGSSPFANCPSLTSIGVAADSQAYSSCDGVLYTKDGTTLIQWPAGQAGSVTIPFGVKNIGWGAFYQCSRLTSVTIPSTVTSIDDNAFSHCTSLTSITLPSSVEQIGKAAFASCVSLASIFIPGSVRLLPADMCLKCTALTQVVISEGVTSISTHAFVLCDSLVSLFLPASIRQVGDCLACGKLLTAIYFLGNAPTLDSGAMLNYGDLYTVYYLPGTTGWESPFAGVDTAFFPASMAPSGIVGIRGNGQVQLSWTAPVSNGGLPVTDYTIQYSSNGGSSWQTFPDAVSAAVTATVTGLTNGTNYLFKVASVNDVGTGLYSANSSVVMPATSPGAPSALFGIRGNGQVQLSWTAPVSNGGLPVKDYLIQYSSDSGASWQTFSHVASATTSATVADLKNGTGYLFKVASINDVGTGLFASTVSKIVPGLVAPPPSGLVASRGNGVVRLSWNAPLSTAGIRVADYAIQYSTNGGVSWVSVRDGVSTRTSAVLSGLTIGRDHIFRIASVGRAGTGDFSSPSGAVRPATVPQAPLRLMATAGLGQAVVSWTTPVSDGGSPITQYVVQYAPRGGRWVTATSVGGNTTSVTVSGLVSNRQYAIRVFAVNDLGMGISSRSVLIKTPPAFAALARV